MRRSRTGCSHRRAGSRIEVCSTSPGATSSRSTAAPPRSRWHGCSVLGAAGRVKRWPRTHSRSPSWARASCGSAGSASTPARHPRRTASRRRRFSGPRPRRAPARAANGVAAQAFIGTQLAACAGLLGWVVVEKLRPGHATTLGAASGAVAGLVAITPACGFVNSLAAIVIGLAGGVVAVLAVGMKYRFRYDDSLDVVGVHGAGGVVGTLLVGVFATQHVNSAIGARGLFSGGGLGLLGEQALAVVVTIAWAFVATWLVAQLVQRTIGLRVGEGAEVEGLDTAVHAESAYDFGNVRAGRIGA